MILHIENLNKGFFQNRASHDLNLQIEQGKVYGLLGPNGSGKTTLFKILAGLVKPTSGKITVNGHNIGVETKRQIAFMPVDDFIFDWMKIKSVLDYYSDMYTDFDRQKALEHLDFMDLREEQKVKNLSTGMRARLKLLVTLARKASLYLLDEPLNGIDIVSRDKIIRMIVSSLRDDSTLIVSSHIVSELEPILDEVIFLDNGKIILTGDTESFRLEKQCSIEELYKEVYHA